MNKELSLIDKIKAILDLPISEKKEVELKASEVIETATAPAETPAETETPKEETDETNQLETLANAIKDLQERVANLESELTMSKEASTKMSAIVELMAKQPTGTAPKKVEPVAGIFTQKTQERKTAKENKQAELNKLFAERKGI